MKVVRKKNVFTAVRIEEEGSLITLERVIKVRPGDVKITDWQGNEDVIDEQQFKNEYVEVDSQEDTTPIGKDFSENDWANAYSQMEEVYKRHNDYENDEYIDSELFSNKAL